MAGGEREDGGSILNVILRRNLHTSIHGRPQEQLSRALLQLHTVRLDREGITALKNLEMVKEVQSLYLQENRIKKIENVEVLQNLRFLSLSCNRVEEIRNFRCLTNLQFLDISHNLIKKLDTNDLPQNLLFLDLTGNPCTKVKDYRQQVIEALPFLQQLDGETVSDSQNQNSLSDSEEENGSNSDGSDETSLPFDVSGGPSSVRQEMIQRSYQRRQKALKEHEERLSELNDTPDKQPLIPPRKDTGNAVSQECSSISLQQATSCTRQTQNPIISEKKHQNSALVKKQLKDQQNNGTSIPASEQITKNQMSASSCQTGAGRSDVGLNRTSSEKLPPSAAPSKADPVPTGKVHDAVTASQADRQAVSAPSTWKMNTVPTKNTLQTPEKTPARHCPVTASSRPLNERQATSAPTKKTPQSLEKLPMTRLKVYFSAEGTRKKTS